MNLHPSAIRYFLFILILFGGAAQAQNDSISVDLVPIENREAGEIFLAVDEMPSFPGGMSEMFNFLGSNLVYPKQSKEDGVEGKVYVRFIVEPSGRISNVKVVRSVSKELDAEAVRVVKKMPRWNPGVKDGKKVRVEMNLPFNFSLKNSSGKEE